MIKTRFFLLLGCVFLLTACNSFLPTAPIQMATQKPVETEKIISLSTSTSLPVSPTPTLSLSVTSTSEISSNIIGQIIPFPGQEYTYLRSEPSSMSDVIAKIQAKQKVSVIGRHIDPPWWKVTVNGISGWVYTDYVFIAGDISKIPCVPASSECKAPLSKENYEKGISAIQRFMQQPDLRLSFQEIMSDPNADMRQMMIFADAQGAHYYVDALKFQVVEYLTDATSEPSNNGKRELAELRALAVTIASRNSSIFLQKGHMLTASENVGNGNFAFRWDDQRLPGKSTRPFLQIIFNSQGEIINYLNTLDVLEN